MKMDGRGYKILIADDEIKILQLIERLGHWDELGIKIVSRCSDGESALRDIEAMKPDIVLTDIKMPLADGIQMMEKAKAKGLFPYFIVISGYRHFEYARSAIQLGVIDYLLKPLNEEQLNRTLKKVCGLIDQERQKKADENQLEDYQRQELSQVRKEMLCCLLGAGPDSSLKSIETCNEAYKTEFKEGCFLCAYISTNIDALLSEPGSLFGEKIYDNLEKLFCQDAAYVSFARKEGCLVLFNYQEAAHEKIKSAISTLFYQIQDLTEIYGKFSLHIGVSSRKNHIRELKETIREAYIAEWGRLVFLGDCVIEYDQIKTLPHFPSGRLLTPERERNLKQYARFFQMDELGDAFGAIARDAARYENHFPGDMQSVMLTFEQQLLPIHMDKASEEELENLRAQCSLSIKRAHNFQQAIREFYLFYEKHLREQHQNIEKRIGKPVEDARAYISQHFGEQLSLDEMASRYDFSPSYFSKLFKTETGMGFSDYLIQVRMDKAKELLVGTNRRVNSIAMEVGYQDDKYFSKLFKKAVGIKPTEFRKLYA